jgi:TfoX/Sxy family transcriptional regulator of competence genes
MASDRSFVEYVVDQLAPDCGATYRQMFGEFAVYSGGKVVALVCDNRVYIKPTAAGRAFIGVVVEAPAYPGAKPGFLIEDRIDDGEWLSELIRRTARELPEPKPKKRKKRR